MVQPAWHGSRMSRSMNLHNALGFGLVGGAMKVLPLLFPSLIEAGGPEGTRALWLLVMSWVMWALMSWGVVAVVLASGAHRVLGVWVFGTEASRLERRREVSAAGARAARVAGGLHG
jgi:succinate dehydrogenase/fumarate reductase cytochrome b subunit